MAILMIIGGIIVNIGMLILEVFLLINVLKEVSLIIKIVIWTIISGLILFIIGFYLGIGLVGSLFLLFIINMILIPILLKFLNALLDQ